MLPYIRRAQKQCPSKQIVQLDAAIGFGTPGDWRLLDLFKHRLAGRLGGEWPQ